MEVELSHEADYWKPVVETEGGSMTVWELLDRIIGGWPPIAALFLIAALVAVIIFIIGYSKHGINFIKYGFKQSEISELGAKIDGLRDELKADINRIEVNHFGHLKNYLGVLNGILLDKDIISNQEKARLDNELRGM